MKLGAHMSIAGGVSEALLRGQELNCHTIQIFTKNNNQWQAKPISKDEADLFALRLKETKIFPVISHDCYLINLASVNQDTEQKSIAAFTDEILRADLLNIPYLVMHPGSHLQAGEKAGINRIAKNLNTIFKQINKTKTMILLETTAGQGTNLGYKFEQLAEIISLIKDKEKIGICLDTCHIFAAGYDIRDKKNYQKTFSEFDKIIGLDKLKVIHLNDSKKDLGCKVDRHEHIGKGFIGLNGFRLLLNDERLKDIPMVLETPKSPDGNADLENLDVLRKLIK